MRLRLNSSRNHRGPRWVPIAQGKKQWNAQAQGTFALREDGASTVGAGQSAEGAVYLDPAETPSLRIEAIVLCNDTASGSTFTFNLRPLGNPDGAATVVANDESQSVVAAAAIAFAAPLANSKTRTVAELDCPAAGFYVVDVTISVQNMAADSAAVTRFRIDALA
jgi:hypothetical protein